MGAQRGVAQRVAIAAVEAVNAPARQFAHGPVQPVFLLPRLRQPSTAGPVLEAVLVRLLPQEPEDVVGPGRLRLGFVRLLRPASPVDIEAGAGPRLDMARGDELIVGVDDGELADTVGGGELADGGQTGAMAQYSLVHQASDPLDDLLGQRRALRRIQMDQHIKSPRVERQSVLTAFAVAASSGRETVCGCRRPGAMSSGGCNSSSVPEGCRGKAEPAPNPSGCKCRERKRADRWAARLLSSQSVARHRRGGSPVVTVLSRY